MICREEMFLFTVAHSIYGNMPSLKKIKVEGKEGKGKIILDVTSNSFSFDWQRCIRIIWNFISVFFNYDISKKDLYFSINSTNTLFEGYSASLPLSLLIVSVLTGEKLQKNVFSTGCMHEPDGWISRGNPKAIEAKIKAAGYFVGSDRMSYKIIFLIPYSNYNYQQTEKIKLIKVKNILEAMKYILPNAYRENKCKIKKLTSIKNQLIPYKLLNKILKYKRCLVIANKSKNINDDKIIDISNNFEQNITILQANIKAKDDLISIYMLKEDEVLFKHTYSSLNVIYAKIPYISKMHFNFE